MSLTKINGTTYIELIKAGAINLLNDIERVNSLNVFPVPDGDTGTNMHLTISGGANTPDTDTSIGTLSKKIARNMVLSGRGNSGVILSQFFKGLSQGLEGLDEATVEDFAKALLTASARSYKVVENPTEGTILTVMREAGDYVNANIGKITNFTELFETYLFQARLTLEKTPDLLPVLKKAGVVDSGGAGLIVIIEGFIRSLNGETLDEIADKKENTGFTADSVLTNGYNIQFVLQLQSSKIGRTNVDPTTFESNLKPISLNAKVEMVDKLIYVSVDTLNPGEVIMYARKYGECLKITIVNLDVEKPTTNIFEDIKAPEIPYKKYATVAVANGDGLVNSLKEMGVDVVVSGGQTMNTSTSDFIEAFKSLNADYIFVFPNNGNILLAAKQAGENYTDAKVIVIPTKTLAEGYSACSMISFESDDVEQITAELNESFTYLSTLEVTYSVRDCVIDDVDVKKGDYICLYQGKLIASKKNRLESVTEAFRVIDDFADKAVMTIICGKNVPIQEIEELKQAANAFNAYLEVYPIEGNQDVYSYIIGIE